MYPSEGKIAHLFIPWGGGP